MWCGSQVIVFGVGAHRLIHWEKVVPDVGVHRLIRWEKDVPLVDTLATVLPEKGGAIFARPSAPTGSRRALLYRTSG